MTHRRDSHPTVVVDTEFSIIARDEEFFARFVIPGQNLPNDTAELGPFSSEDDARLYFNHFLNMALKAGAWIKPDKLDS